MHMTMKVARAAVAAVAVAGVLAPATAAAAPSLDAMARPGAVSGQRPVPGQGAVPGQGGRAVFLVNGARVVVGPRAGARGTAVTRPAGGGAAGPLMALSLAGKSYLLPPQAVPYLGRGLAPGLFDATAVASREQAGRLPVTVTYRSRAPRLPGVTVTHAAGGVAAGYLTEAGARAFGAALARQFAVDHARGSYGQDGMFGGGVSVALAGDGTAGRAAPPARHFPMHTLTVTGTDLAGRPDTGDEVWVLNVDNSNRFSDPLESISFFYHGTARYSVPSGHYLALAMFSDLSGTRLTGWHVTALPQFTVSRPAATVHLDARAATSKLQWVTPRPADARCCSTVFLVRAPAVGQAYFFEFNPWGIAMWVSPTRHTPLTGALRESTTAFLPSPANHPGTPYEYHLANAGPEGVIPPVRYVVRPASLATVAARYDQPAASTGGVAAFGYFPFQVRYRAPEGAAQLPVALPRRAIQYYSAGPSLLWLAQYVQAYSSETGGQADSFRVLHPGQRLPVSWNAFPLHPAPNTNLLGAVNPFATLPSASRAGNTLTLDITPFSDNVQGHTGSGFSRVPPGTVRGRYAIFSDGIKIAGGDAARAAHGHPDLRAAARLARGPHHIRFVLAAARTGPLYRLSPASRTVWTWRSAPRPGATLPAGWTCADNTRSCAVQPMMTVEYAVAGLSLRGSARPGRQVLRLAAGHLQLAKATPVTRAAVSVSFDGGTTWHPATVTGHRGSYTAVFTAPAGVTVSLRASAADAAGGAVTETITSAYQIAP
jgi:hypothetical protein